jgi:hypothetical protein
MAKRFERAANTRDENPFESVKDPDRILGDDEETFIGTNLMRRRHSEAHHAYYISFLYCSDDYEGQDLITILSRLETINRSFYALDIMYSWIFLLFNFVYMFIDDTFVTTDTSME